MNGFVYGFFSPVFCPGAVTRRWPCCTRSPGSTHLCLCCRPTCWTSAAPPPPSSSECCPPACPSYWSCPSRRSVTVKSRPFFSSFQQNKQSSICTVLEQLQLTSNAVAPGEDILFYFIYSAFTCQLKLMLWCLANFCQKKHSNGFSFYVKKKNAEQINFSELLSIQRLIFQTFLLQGNDTVVFMHYFVFLSLSCDESEQPQTCTLSTAAVSFMNQCF